MISELTIVNNRKQSVYTYKAGKTRAVEKPAPRAGNNADGTDGNETRKNGGGISKDRGLSLAQMAELERELKRTGVPLQMVLDRYLLSSLDEMTEANFEGAMKGLLRTKSKNQKAT